jgi:hypothetical protein
MRKTRCPSPPADDRSAGELLLSLTSVFTSFSFRCRMCGFARYGRDTWTKHSFYFLANDAYDLFSFLQKRSGDAVRLDIGLLFILVTTHEG